MNFNSFFIYIKKISGDLFCELSFTRVKSSLAILAFLACLLPPLPFLYGQEAPARLEYQLIELFSFNCDELKIDYRQSLLNCSRNSEISAFMNLKSAKGEKFIFYSNITGTLYVFSAGGEFEKAVKIVESSVMADYPQICDMAFSKAGLIYILDCANAQVTVLNSDFKIINKKRPFDIYMNKNDENFSERKLFSPAEFNYISVDYMQNIRLYNPFEHTTVILGKSDMNIVKVIDGRAFSFSAPGDNDNSLMVPACTGTSVEIYHQADDLNSKPQKIAAVNYNETAIDAFHIGTGADGKMNYFYVKTLNFDRVKEYILEVDERGTVKSNINAELRENFNKNFKIIMTPRGSLAILRKNNESYSVCELKKTEIYDSE